MLRVSERDQDPPTATNDAGLSDHVVVDVVAASAEDGGRLVGADGETGQRAPSAGGLLRESRRCPSPAAGVAAEPEEAFPPGSPSGAPTAVQLAEYAGGRLKVEATSSSSSATMKVHVTSTNALIGTLTNDGGGRYRGEFNWPSNPQSITVRSSLGGSTTRTVIAK